MFDFALQKILLGTTLIGITSGLLGVFTFLRKQSLLGDAISHAALPGITIIFLLTRSQHPVVLFCGGFIAGLIGTVFVSFICKMTKLKKDAALGIVLSVFFGLGLVLLTVVQKMPLVGQAFLHRFLFGDASTLLLADLYFIAAMSSIVCALTILFWKEFKLISFDPLFAHVSGFAVATIEFLLTILLVITIVMGLQMVGVILMSALFIASAAAARQLTHSLALMAMLSAACGGISCICGTLISGSFDNVPTGPAIVICASFMVVVSFLVARMTQRIKNKRLS